jgi:hypothetical protein
MDPQPRQAPKSSSTGLFLGMGLLWRQFLQPNFQIMMQPRFIIVYEDAGRNMHGIAQQQPFLYTALSKGLLNLGSDVDKLSSSSGLKPQFFPKGFHLCSTSWLLALRYVKICR